MYGDVVSPMHAFAHALAHVLKMTYQADYEAGVRRHTDRLLLRRALADSSIDQKLQDAHRGAAGTPGRKGRRTDAPSASSLTDDSKL